MECPILVWMLSINRDVTTEVCSWRLFSLEIPSPKSLFHRCHRYPSRLTHSDLGAFLPLMNQEYDKCYNLVKECVPHTKFPYECTSIESFRESHLSIFFPDFPLLYPSPARTMH